MRTPVSQPVRMKVYGSPRTPAPTMAMNTLANVFGVDDNESEVSKRGVSSLGTDRMGLEDEVASFWSANTIVID
ncbi:hypothetical protein Hanom_Chr15g01367271 [Helianthus anomalus]